MNISAPGPTGILKINQIIKSIVHTTKNVMVYGIIVAISVPIPAFLSYLFINAIINAKYDIIGEMMFVTLSPTL